MMPPSEAFLFANSVVPGVVNSVLKGRFKPVAAAGMQAMMQQAMKQPDAIAAMQTGPMRNPQGRTMGMPGFSPANPFIEAPSASGRASARGMAHTD